MPRLICLICDWEDDSEQAEFKSDNDGGFTLMCSNDCQKEDETDLEILDTSTVGTEYLDSYGEGRLLWWMDKELYKKHHPNINI